MSRSVNPHRLRLSARRLFNGNTTEILHELLQNAQRAGATQVTIDGHEGVLTITDNGHGINDWIDLLSLGGSNYSNEQVNHQHPMGIGIHSLLSNEEIRSVLFESNGYSIKIVDVESWWNDRDYYERIFDDIDRGYLEPSDVRQGLRITIKATEDVANNILFAASGNPQYNTKHHYNTSSIANGYADIFTLYVNGEQIALAHSNEAYDDSMLLFTFTYEGNDVSCYGHCGRSMVNWYGQEVTLPTHGSFGIYANIRSGRPFDMLAPTRSGVIKNRKWGAFLEVFRGHLHDYVRHNLHKLTVDQLGRYFARHQRALELPVFLATPLVENEYLEEDEFSFLCEEMFPYNDPPHLFHTSLTIMVEDEWESARPALSTFLPLLREAGYTPYKFIHGRIESVSIFQVYWKPGDVISHDHGDSFRDPGVWGVGTATREPDTWFPVSTPVLAVFDTSTWDIDSAKFIAGGDPITALREWGHLLYESSEDEDSWDQWEKTFNDLIASLTSEDHISQQFYVNDLRWKLPSRSPIKTVEYEYNEIGVTVAVIVTNMAGETRRFLVIN